MGFKFGVGEHLKKKGIVRGYSCSLGLGDLDRIHRNNKLRSRRSP
jgi:hypothetical protein